MYTIQNWVALEGISGLVQFAPAFMGSSSQGTKTGYILRIKVAHVRHEYEYLRAYHINIKINHPCG